MRAVRIALIALCLQSISGCAHYYTPSPSRPFESIHEFSSTNSVTLQNGQSSKEQISFHTRYYANYNAWTDIAISITERELTKRGLQIVKDTPKTLTLSIESAHTEIGWWLITSQIVMHVETSDGYATTFTGKNSSAMVANIERQIDGAIMRVVVEMLKDQRIVSFLTK